MRAVSARAGGSPMRGAADAPPTRDDARASAARVCQPRVHTVLLPPACAAKATVPTARGVVGAVAWHLAAVGAHRLEPQGQRVAHVAGERGGGGAGGRQQRCGNRGEMRAPKLQLATKSAPAHTYA